MGIVAVVIGGALIGALAGGLVLLRSGETEVPATGQSSPTVAGSPPPSTAATPGEPRPVIPLNAQASAVRPAVSKLACTQQRNDFVATHLIDGDPQTGWGAGRGNGAGEWVEISFGEPVLLSRIGLTPGYNRVAPRSDQGCATVSAFAFNRYVSRVRYRFDDGSDVVVDLPGVADVVWTDVAVRTETVVIELLETVQPSGSDNDTILSDAYFEARG